MVFCKDGNSKGLQKIVQKHGKVVGLFGGRKPELLIADEKLLTDILVKQFNSFEDHNNILTGHKYLDGSVFLLHGEHWRRVRRLLSPSWKKRGSSIRCPGN